MSPAVKGGTLKTRLAVPDKTIYITDGTGNHTGYYYNYSCPCSVSHNISKLSLLYLIVNNL